MMKFDEIEVHSVIEAIRYDDHDQREKVYFQKYEKYDWSHSDDKDKQSYNVFFTKDIKKACKDYQILNESYPIVVQYCRWIEKYTNSGIRFSQPTFSPVYKQLIVDVKEKWTVNRPKMKYIER